MQTQMQSNNVVSMALPPPLPSDSSSMATAACSTSVDDNRDKDLHGDGGGGMVVVGFVGSGPTTDGAHLINRIIDADIFGSAAKDIPLRCFRRHRITYHYDDSASTSASDKGILFLLLSSSSSSCSSSSSEEEQQEEEEEEFESDHLRGMLFMFSVSILIN